MPRAQYLTHPLIELAGGGLPQTGIPGPSRTMLGREVLQQVALNPPASPPAVAQPTSIPQPPPIARAGIDW